MFSIDISAQQLTPKIEEYRKRIHDLLSEEINPTGPKLDLIMIGGYSSQNSTIQAGVLEMTIHISNGRLSPAIDRIKLRNRITQIILQNPLESVRVIPEVIYLMGDDDHFSSYWKFDGETVHHYHGDGSRHEVQKQGSSDFACFDCSASCLVGP